MPCGRGVAARRDHHIDHLAVLVDRQVEVAPAARNFDIGLVHEPPVAGCASGWTGGVDELRREGLHPSVHRDVVDGDAALGQQLFDIAVGQAVAQVPPTAIANSGVIACGSTRGASGLQAGVSSREWVWPVGV